MTLICAIFGTFFVLTYGKSSSIALLIFFIIMSLQSVSFFVISCEKLFDVPNKLRLQKRTLGFLLEHQGKRMTREDEKQCRYRIEALATVGISDGGFRKMESISTLLYLEFFLNSVINLLLM